MRTFHWRVLGADAVAKKRPSASGRILVCGVGKEGSSADTCVELTVGETQERKHAKGSIVSAGRETKKCVLPFCCVASGITAIRRRIDRISFWRRDKEGERQYDEECLNSCFHGLNFRKNCIIVSRAKAWPPLVPLDREHEHEQE